MAKNVPTSGEYKYGFHDKDVSVFRTEKGLTRKVVEEISNMKEEPEWMLEYRLKALEHFYKRPMPQWGGDLSELEFDELKIGRASCRERVEILVGGEAGK